MTALELDVFTRAVALGLVCWLLTIIVTDSVLLAPGRTIVSEWAERARFDRVKNHPVVRQWLDAGDTHVCRKRCLDHVRAPMGWQGRLAYLVTCNLCAGTWIGLAIALVAGGVFEVRLIGWVLSGLLYKAVGHLVYAVQRALEAAAA